VLYRRCKPCSLFINNEHGLLAVEVCFGREGLCDFGWSWKTEVMGGFDFCDTKMLRE